jgi:ribosomal protein S18 acetylase RimI-like enzyme
MELVDLNGRQDESDVLRILKQSHGSERALDEARDNYRTGEWTFIGLREGGEIIACAGAEELDPGTIGIRSIAVAPTWRNQGLGRKLLEVLAGRLRADRIVAETDDDAVGFYRRCDFTVEDAPPKFGRARFWCVYTVGK